MPLDTPLGFGFPTATPHGLTSRHAADSQAHSSKGTPSHTNGALTDCKRMVSGTLSLPSRGTFHHSLTVLSTIGHTEYLGLPGGPGRFTADSTSPLLLGENTNNTTTHTFTYRTFHLLRCTIPDASADMCTSRLQLAACNICAPQHRTRNPCQVSHAHGLASSAIARHYTRNHNCFLLLRVLRCFTSPRQPPHRLCIHLRVTPHNRCWVSPFGHPRINALLATPRGITQPHTSFIGSACQGIHHTPVTKHTDTQTIKVQTPKHKKERYSRPLYSSHTTQPPHTTNHNQRGQPT